MANEKKTDIFIAELLKSAAIKYTPNGSDIKEIQQALKTASKKGTGKSGFPEFVAISKDFILVIEDKSELEKQALYEDDEQQIIATTPKAITNYAENGALHYAKEIIAKTNFKKIFAFGCTGNEKHHIIRPIFVDKTGYKLLDKVENFENFTIENIEKYYKEQVLGETPQETLELEDILKKAKELHESLRNYGQLGDAEKPLVVSALMLALSEESFSIDQLTGDTLKTDGQKIYDALATHMERVQVQPIVKKDKVLNQFTIIKDRTLLNQKDERLKVEISKNSYLEKTPLKYFAEYIQKNILSSVKANTTEDVLGRFYGEFMRYGNNDGQTLGVILTPKHITELFSDLIELKPSDKIFDPCCGTGGFLIAGMHKMLNEAKTKAEKAKIKKDQIHGIELRENMFAIATTNMILRGDGKSNLIQDDFLKQNAEELKKNNYTVGFINPPYSQAKGKDTAHLSEINFIKHLLDSLAEGGRCVAIIPQSTMVGKTKEDKTIKKQILESHTLEGVITLNKSTFYGVGTNTCIAIFTAHKPHSDKKYCKFVNYEDDGYVVSKHIGLVETTRAVSQKTLILDCWLHDKPIESRFMVKTTIEPEDEWLHSFYYFNDEIPKEEDFEKTIADYLTFEFNMVMQGREYLFDNQFPQRIDKVKDFKKVEPLIEKQWGEFYLNQIFTEIKRGKRLKKEDHKKGEIPYVSSSGLNNGIDGFVNNKERVRIFKNCLSIANSGSVGATFYQPFSFVASDHVAKLENSNFNESIYLFISSITKRLSEKYSFNREINDARIQREKILLPIDKKGQPDYDYMENYIKKLEYEKLTKYLTRKTTQTR